MLRRLFKPGLVAVVIFLGAWGTLPQFEAGRLHHGILRIRRAVRMTGPRDHWTPQTARLLDRAPPRVRDLVLMRDSTLVRWRADSELRIYVSSMPSLDGWSDDLPERLQASIDAWMRTLIPVSVVYVEDPLQATVSVLWTRRLEGELLGQTQLQFNELDGIVEGTITIALHDAEGRRVEPEKMDATLLHEAGHLFGLVHTQDASSSMHPRSRIVTPSPSDVETIQTLYDFPLGPLPREQSGSGG